MPYLNRTTAGCCLVVLILLAAHGVAGDPAQRPARPPAAVFTPTWQPIVYEMLDLAGVTGDDVVYDLGSGDGRIVIVAAQKYGARGVGIERQPELVRLAREVAREAEVLDRVAFVEGDLFAADISPATVVTLYLSASINRALESKLKRELRPGTRIVSHQFPIGDWPPERTVRSAENPVDLFLWRVPPR
jgi:SAM-dependent methyltransferase